jgi:hypothetical protein
LAFRFSRRTATRRHATPGKLADVELHFTGGVFDGLKLVGLQCGANAMAKATT